MKTSLAAQSLIGLFLLAVGTGNAQQAQTYVATLTGQDAFPPVVTNAVGAATLTAQNGALKYDLEVGSIKGVTSACIHVDSPQPAVVMLYTGPETGAFTGVLASGTIQAASLGGLTLDEFLSAVREGNAYVSIHTVAHPGGEIQGKLALAKPEKPAGG